MTRTTQMVMNNFDWKTSLATLFGGTVNQQTLEKAAELMVSVSASDDSYHEECLTVLDQGIRTANSGDNSILACINKSGYQVSTTTEAAALLNDFRTIYLMEYRRVSNIATR